MRGRVDLEHARAALPGDPPAPLATPALAPAGAPFDADADLGHGLPSDHPAWARDTVSISQRARALFANVKPVAMRILTLWDQAVRSVTIGGRRLSVDASGSYRMP